MSLARYPEYKPSGLAWLGDVPVHFDVCAMKRMMLNITDGAHVSPETEGGIYDFVSTKDINDAGIDFDGSLKTSPSSYEYLVRTGCKPLCGDVLFSKDGTIGRTVVVKESHEFVVASSLIIIRPDSTVLDSTFLHYLCQSFVVTQQVEGFVKGAGLPRLSIQNLLKVFGVFPSLLDQQSIATFLDRETQKIDALIAEQRRLVDVLTEKRQAMISHAVTKGLNPNAMMKDSGIVWLGQVPEHWEVKRLKLLCDVQTGDKDTVDAIDEGEYPFFVRSQTVERINTFTFDCEAVLTAGDGVGVGKVFHYVNGKFDFHQRVYMMNNFRWVTGKFFFRYLAALFHKVALDGGAKSTVDSLRMPLFMNFVISVPPNNEQSTIVAFIDTETAKFDTLTDEANRAIDLLQERRSALIFASVTGMIDVRGMRE